MKEGPPKCIQVDHTHMHTNRKPPLLHLVYHLGSYADVHCRQTPSSIFQEGAKHHFAFVPSDCCHLQLIPLLPDTSHPSNAHFFFRVRKFILSKDKDLCTKTAQKCYKFKYFSWRLFLVLISLSSFYSFAFNSHFAYCVFALMHLVNVLSINIDLLTLS